jgi:hypothetical protein
MVQSELSRPVQNEGRQKKISGMFVVNILRVQILYWQKVNFELPPCSKLILTKNKFPACLKWTVAWYKLNFCLTKVNFDKEYILVMPKVNFHAVQDELPLDKSSILIKVDFDKEKAGLC